MIIKSYKQKIFMEDNIMATTIRLEHLLPQGEEDKGGCSFTVSREDYKDLKVMPEMNFSDDSWTIEKATFKEIYRNHLNDDSACHLAVRFFKEKELMDDEYLHDRHKYWYAVWIKKEQIWIAFEYYDLASLDDTYTSTVEVSIPVHGEIYRPNEEVCDIINLLYCMD